MNRQEKIEHIRKGKFFAWGDAAVFAAAFLLIAVFTLFAFLGVGAERGDVFSVYYRNEKIFTAPLSEEAVYIFSVEDGHAAVRTYDGEPELSSCDYNIIEVSDGKVRVSGANCPDHICELWGSVGGGEINCLPHQMKIAVHRVEGGTDA